MLLIPMPPVGQFADDTQIQHLPRDDGPETPGVPHFLDISLGT
jgi:hypothetical protein